MTIDELTKKCTMVSEILKSVSHPARLKILCLLIEAPKTVRQLEEGVGISQSAMSQYLMDMWHQKLLNREKTGQTVYYAIKDLRLIALMTSLQDIFCKGAEHHDI